MCAVLRYDTEFCFDFCVTFLSRAEVEHTVYREEEEYPVLGMGVGYRRTLF